MERQRAPVLQGFLALLVLAVSTGAALARPASCATTDDGSFKCNFRATSRDGSFEISSPGKPTYMLQIIEPGATYGFVTRGGRNISLPGRYLRSTTEPGCWVNDVTRTKICAR